MVKGEKRVSEGLKQKIQELHYAEMRDLREAETPLDVEKSSGRMELLGKVLVLIDETAKQIQDEIKRNSETLRSTEHPHSERYESVLFARIEMLNWVLTVLEGDGKEKAKP